MSSTPVAPPLDGSIPPLPGFVDFHATHNPDHEWARLAPEDKGPVIGLTFREFADATHRVARTFRPDGTRANGEVIAVLIHCDAILYLALLGGLVRAGFVPFPMSPKNTAEAVINMVQKTSCTRIISQEAFAPVIKEIEVELCKKGTKLQYDELPALPKIWPQFGGNLDETVEHFPAPTKPHSKEDIVLYLHSSGSTGLPKPIPQSQVAVLQWCSSPVHQIARDEGISYGSMPLPTFHTMGIYQQLYIPLVSGYAVGLYAPKYPAAPVVPTPVNTIEACKAVGSTGIAIIPAFIEYWAQFDKYIEYLKTLKILAFAGGPLSDINGNKLAKAGIRLYSVYGGTEFGVHTTMPPVDDSQGPDAPWRTSADWAWLSFPEERMRLRWDPQGDGTYVLQVLTCETHCPAVENLPDARGYSTHDLFVPHPTKKGLWKITGRKDDVIVLGTGEKVVPISQEGIITADAMVAGAVVFGRGKNQCGLLVEPRPEYAIDPEDQAALIAFRNKIWPAVEKANHAAPAFGRIFKEMIIVTNPAKPLPRAAKGTIVRPQALALYANEIETLYNVVAESGDAKGVSPPTSWSTEDVETWLISLSASVNGGAELSPTRDVFDQGFDSLHATFLRNRIVAALRSSNDDDAERASTRVSQNFVYDHPTLRELAVAITSLFKDEAPASEHDPTAEIKSMLQTYASHLPKPVAAGFVALDGAVVLLTGSTGNVGSHILASLLAEPRIKRVYTLNRASSSNENRQTAAFEARGLPVNLLQGGKLVKLAGDVTRDRLGLSQTAFDEMKAELTHVIHNAWRVDFNLSLASFETHLAGTRRLVDFCCSLPRPTRLLFTSSVAAAHRWDASRGNVPDEVLTDPEVPSPNGYGQSKFVAENILGQAAANGLDCASLRVGQVCGSKSTGAWGTTEWVPILVKSSVALGMLPNMHGVVPWIPMDAVATAVKELVLSEQRLPKLVNVVHPHPVPWRTIVEEFKASLGKSLKVVSYDEWISAVEAVAERGKAEDLERVPAVKILTFLRSFAKGDAVSGSDKLETGGVALYSAEKLQVYSPTVKSLEPLGPEYVDAWVRFWKNQGFISA